jgi:serine O-acetyltransferase
LLAELIIRSVGGFFRFKSIANNSRSSILRKIYSSLYYYYLGQHASYIGLNTTFKNEPCFPHGVNGIFISHDAVIGKNCVIFPNVIIGSNSTLDSKGFGAPCVGDNCMIGGGATIIGNVRVGDNCRIGANVTVTEDIPSNCLVVSVKPRIIRKSDLNNKFYRVRNGKWAFYQDGKFNSVTDSEVLRKLDRSIVWKKVNEDLTHIDRRL